MSLVNVAYLVLVVAGFGSFFVGLFSVWVWSNWSEWFPARTESAGREPEARCGPEPFRKAA